MDGQSEQQPRKFSDDIQKIIIDNGDKILIHTQVCVEHMMAHKNCIGCPSSLGYGKLASIMYLTLLPTMYHPTSFEDFEKMSNSISTRIDKVLKAQTLDEIAKIRSGQ